MTFGDMKTRVREIIEDLQSTQVQDTELINKMNMAKDLVFGIIRTATNKYPRTIINLSFAAGQKTINLISYYILDFIRISRLSTTGEVIRTYNVSDMGRPEYLIDTEFRIYRDVNGAWTLERNYVGDSLAIQLECTVDIPDLTDTDDETELLFGPNPTNNLIICKTAEMLFGSRKRLEQAAYWQRLGAELEFTLRQTINMHNKVRPRMVHYVG